MDLRRQRRGLGAGADNQQVDFPVDAVVRACPAVDRGVHAVVPAHAEVHRGIHPASSPRSRRGERRRVGAAAPAARDDHRRLVAGANATELRVARCEPVAGAGASSTSSSTVCITRFISSWANAAATQRRTPLPNGIHV